MKYFFFILSLTVYLFGYTQTETINELNNLIEKNTPEKGSELCTSSYWNYEFGKDGAKETIYGLCKRVDEGRFLIIDSIKQSKRTVFKTKIANEEVYIFTIKEKNVWKIDGIHQRSEFLTSPFLNGICSGHFSYNEIPNLGKLQKIGEKISYFSLQKDVDKLNNYCEKYFTERSYLRVIKELTKKEIQSVELTASGFHEKLNCGFLTFNIKGNKPNGESITFDLTLYLSSQDNRYLAYKLSSGTPITSVLFYYSKNKNPFKKEEKNHEEEAEQ